MQMRFGLIRRHQQGKKQVNGLIINRVEGDWRFQLHKHADGAQGIFFQLAMRNSDAVANAVAAMNQTYVNDLKAAGTFNEAEQKEALMRAVSAALKSMSRDAQDYIKSNFGDTTQYLENRIEAQIDANHVAAKQAAVQNTLNLG